MRTCSLPKIGFDLMFLNCYFYIPDLVKYIARQYSKTEAKACLFSRS